MADFRKYCSEIRVSGHMASGGASVLGRVRFFDESYSEGSILCVRVGERVDRELLLLCPPLAVIVFCRDSISSVCELCSIGVPCIVLNDGDISCDFCKDKVALIDTERGILTLDPSIDTIEFYSSSERKKGFPTFACPSGRILSDLRVERRSFFGTEHFIVSDKLLSDGDSIFESAVSLWEKLCPEALTVELCVPKGADGEARDFSFRAEELFRAGLYGSFALSLCGFDCEDELSFALRLLHEAFCLLEAEGREFNGYMPRGITLSSPLWLMRPSPVSNPDFIVFDFDSLIPSFFSLSHEEIIKKEKALKKELFSVFERYFLSFAPCCDIFIKSKLFLNTQLLFDAVRFTNAKAVFF